LYQTSAWDALFQKGRIRETAQGYFHLNERIAPRTFSERYPVGDFVIRALLLGLAVALISWLLR